MADTTVKSAARAFEIIEAFRSERRRLTAAQLGPLLDYPRSSLNVLLKSLTTQGYLSFAAHDQTYFPTLRVTHLGDWVPTVMFGNSSALQHLHELRDRTRETVTLTMATGEHMRCLVALNGNFPIGLQLEEGTLFPMLSSGVGIAYLSSLADGEIDALLKGAKGGRSGKSGGLNGRVASEISKARADGYCTMYDAVLADAGAIAMPIEVPVYGETLVVAVAGLSPRIKATEASILRDLKRCVARIGPRSSSSSA